MNEHKNQSDEDLAAKKQRLEMLAKNSNLSEAMLQKLKTNLLSQSKINDKNLANRIEQGLQTIENTDIKENAIWYYMAVSDAKKLIPHLLIAIITALGMAYIAAFGFYANWFNIIFTLFISFIIAFTALAVLSDKAQNDEEKLKNIGIYVLTPTFLYLMQKYNYHIGNKLIQSIKLTQKINISNISAIKTIDLGLFIYTNSTQPDTLILPANEAELLKKQLLNINAEGILDADNA